MLSGDSVIEISVNGELRQHAKIRDLIWNVSEIIFHLSCLFELKAGDLIFTGTPAGVGQVVSGDKLVGKIDGVGKLVTHIE